jgi:hypothetical protein
MPPKAKKVAPAESRKRQASNADEQPVKRSRRGRQNDDDDNQEDPAADEWADREDQATKTKGRGGRGGNRGRATPKYVRRYRWQSSMTIAID